METQKLWLEITIAGFVYLAAGFFLLLSCLGINDLAFFAEARAFLPYVSVLVLALSYVCGLSIDVISHRVIANLKKRPYDANKDVSISVKAHENLQRRLRFSYATLLLFRHLIFGPFILGISLTIWLLRTEFNYLWPAVVIPCSLLVALSSIAYSVQRANHIDLEAAAEKFVDNERENPRVEQKRPRARRKTTQRSTGG